MTDRTQDQDVAALLTGFWTGVFDTDDLSYEATPFHIFLYEEAGLIGGESIEPNTFSPDPASELFSSIEGWRDGAEIEFHKRYEDAVGAGFTVRFEGAVDGAASQITGVWTRLGSRPSAERPAHSGPFVMNLRTRTERTRADADKGR